VTFGKIRPELSTNVLLGVEKQSSVLVLPELSSNSFGKIKLIQSRKFLGEIVDSLSLQFILPKYNRSALLTFVDVDSTVLPGKYRFSIDERSNFNYAFYFTNNEMGYERKVINAGSILNLDTLHTTGITLCFLPDFLKNPFSFDFYIAPRDKAIEDLRRKISILGNTRRDPMMEGVVFVGLSGSDPELISLTINTIADKFVEKNLSFLKRKTNEVMKALYHQLQSASAQLLQDENKIRDFKEQYPEVGLPIDAQNAISNLTLLDSKDIAISNEIEQLTDLFRRLSDQSNIDNDQITSEALLYLSTQKNPGAIIIQQELNGLIQQKLTLLANRYSPNHPAIKEIQMKIDVIKEKTKPLVNDFIKRQELEIAQTKARKTHSLNQLKSLPQKEMHLAALTRQQQINSDIYSTILSRYNQAKIANETEVPDIYIMDYSVPPEDLSARKELFKLIALGLLVCFLISFSPAIIANIFDKRVRTEDDFRRFMPFPLLETIPILKKNRKKNKKNRDYSILNQKLLTIGPDATYVHELYRSLRAKVNYCLQIANGNSFMITSYDSGDGKSLIAANLAIIAAQQHAPTLLIDGDMRRGLLHESFAVKKEPGLSDLLTNHLELTEQYINSFIKTTSFPNLFLLTSGSLIQNPTELLTSSHFEHFMDFIHSKFSMIIIDAPPLAPVTDPIMINNTVAGSVLIVRAGKTNTAALNKIINEFPALKEKIMGVVLNGVLRNNRRKKYNSYYHNYPEKAQIKSFLPNSKEKVSVT
jgi:tyrosine-protein kinase Etk/Wzc